MANKDKPFKDFPLGHFHPSHLARTFAEECALIGGLVIAWGQFDKELCNLFSRLLGFPLMQPTDRRAHALFYASTNTKARRDAMVSLIKMVDDPLCREWLTTAVEKAGDAGDKRNNIIHSEYFADLLDPSDSHLMQNKPATKKPEIKRNNIRQQITDAIVALDEARFYMEFAFAATHGKKNLEQALKTYEPALRERHARKQRGNQPPDSR
jgi:hypothetical protein